jgi:hypothetical protein
MSEASPPDKAKRLVDEIDLDKVDSVVLRRLIEEVRLGIPSAFAGFDRTYNRHNR